MTDAPITDEQAAGDESPAAESDASTARTALEGESLTALRKQASDLNIEGRTKLEREDLINAILDARSVGDRERALEPSSVEEVGREPLAEVAEQRAKARQTGRVIPGADAPTTDDQQEA